MGGEAPLQQQLEDERQIDKQTAEEGQHCDHLLADARLLPDQLFHLQIENWCQQG